MSRNFRHLIIIPVIFLLLAVNCTPGKEEKKGLGLVETPEMLYKSFRAAAPKGHEGAAPALAGDVDLSALFPEPGDQGQIGSCTAWSTAYACKSYQENLEREWGAKANAHRFSPSFIYNQINGGVDYGAPLELAVALVITLGSATLESMPYTENYRQAPPRAAYDEAAQYKAKSFARVESNNLDAVKAVLADGNPVLIGMMVYENLYLYKSGVYSVTDGSSLGGHAMCVVGYDDAKSAFKIINSWGTRWGERGYLWLDYALFKRDVVTCLVMYDEIITRPQIAAAPVNVEASQGTADNQVKVVWDAAANAVSYIVFRSDNPSQYFKEIARTRGALYLDNSVRPGVIYYYAVKSVSTSSRESDFSGSAKGYAGSLENEVGIPQDLEGIFTDNSAYLKWNAVKSVTGYYVYRFDKASGNYLRIGETADASYRDTGTFTGQDVLWYMVTAYKNNRESNACIPVAITVNITFKPLNPPRRLKASRTFRDRIEVTWQAVKGAESYKFYKYYVNEEKWKFITELKEPLYTDSEPGTLQAFYIVTAKNANTVSGPSEPAWGWVADFKNKPKAVKYDDAAYYDDTDYFADTDYTNTGKYKDDKPYADNTKKETYTGYTDDGKGKKEKDTDKEKPGPGKTKEKTEQQKEREADDKFLKDDSKQGETGKVLEKARPKTDGKSTDSKLQNKVKGEIEKEDKDFFADDEDEAFFADEDDEDF